MELFSFIIFGHHIAINFYGLMYAVGFMSGYYLLKKHALLKIEPFDTLFYYAIFGAVLGGRIGYILFYNLGYYLENPMKMIAVWEGGMSFHGGVLGVILASYIFHKIYKVAFLKITDAMALAFPIGLFFGRIGNYMNKELLGFEYYGPLAVAVGDKSYFPSPLIEALLEGIVLLIIILVGYRLLYKKRYPSIVYGYLSSLFLIFYAIFRILVEYFFREPDAHIGYIWGHISLGSILSAFMIVAGIGIYIYIRNKNHETIITK